MRTKFTIPAGFVITDEPVRVSTYHGIDVFVVRNPKGAETGTVAFIPCALVGLITETPDEPPKNMLVS